MADGTANADPDSSMDATIAHMSLNDWLDDLTVRFLLNLPAAELSSVPRLCFQVEEAQWFYEDFARPANPKLPSLNLRSFCLTLFRHCPLLKGFNTEQHLAAYEEFLAYKVRVPVRGAILMDDHMEKVLLVRGWKKGASWSFPRGKINKNESDLDCAIREVYEETGFDIAAAGLVESNDQGNGSVKAIDVTMREQHMKLFVFRGVKLDTYFEPRTRKEISKIEWYNVKDLPGFKKSKGAPGLGHGAAQATKFYMVAPFLGNLKKWINQQRQKDAAAAQQKHYRNVSGNEDLQTTTTEDEGVETEGFNTDNGFPAPQRSADELKRLLSIGGPTLGPLPPPQFAPTDVSAHTGSLLSMLKAGQTFKGSGFLPHTPFDQIDPPIPPQEPQTPHPQPQHARHSSSGMQQPRRETPPQFDYSPQRLQQEQHTQRHTSVPSFGFPGPGFGPGSFAQQHPTPGMPPHMQPQMFQQQHQQRQHSMPITLMQQQTTGPHSNSRPNSAHLPQPLQYPNLAIAHPRPTSQQMPPGFQSFGGSLASPMPQPSGVSMPRHAPLTHATLGTEASAPEAAKLPAPKLNAHAMKLLDALKSGNRGATKASASGPSNGQRAGSQQQAALLNLFKKPSVAQQSPNPATEEHRVNPPTSPALTDVTVKPHKERKPRSEDTVESPAQTHSATALEGGRQSSKQPALHRSSKASLASPAWKNGNSLTSKKQDAQPSVILDAEAERPKPHGELFDPSNPKKPDHAIREPQKRAMEPPLPPTSILQRSPSQPASKSPRPVPKQKAKPQPESGQSMPQFSILQRPGSSGGKAARAPSVNSPLRHETPKGAFQPQVLKRPSVEAAENTEPVQRQSSVVRTPVDGGGKTDQLLALFGKTSVSPPAPVPPMPIRDVKSPVAPEPRREHQQQNLLNLFNGNKAGITIRTPEPPPPPQLLPERKPSSQGQKPATAQLNLLNLFTKQTSGSGANSPGTPISPFTLGTPASREMPFRLPGTTHESDASTSGIAPPRSRIGSVASVLSNGGGSGQQTPTEAKDMLLGYLNGVVQKEGYRGSRRN